MRATMRMEQPVATVPTHGGLHVVHGLPRKLREERRLSCPLQSQADDREVLLGGRGRAKAAGAETANDLVGGAGGKGERKKERVR